MKIVRAGLQQRLPPPAKFKAPPASPASNCGTIFASAFVAHYLSAVPCTSPVTIPG